MTLDTAPKRIQRKRVKGWKTPPNTVYVGRPSQWGNRFTVEPDTDPARLEHYADYTKNVDLWDEWPVKDAATAVRAFRKMQCHRRFRERVRAELKGKNLSCWCPPGSPCHADVLLCIANS